MTGDITLDHLHWDRFNETGKPITLVGSQGTPFVFNPGDRLILPKQVEGLNAIRIYKAVGWGGAMGGGKSVWGEQGLFDLLFEWSVPGHYHGPHDAGDAPCMISHVGVRVFLISQTLQSIRLRHIDQILLPRYGDLGTLNKNEWEFTLHEEYGSHMVTMIGTENVDKLKSIDGAAAFHDEATLDDWKVFGMVMKRLRWPRIPHCPYFWAANPTGRSRLQYKENFVDNPRQEYVDEEGVRFPGFFYIHCTARDNPTLDPSYVYELEQGTQFEVEAYLEGSWEHPEGAYYQLENGIHIIPDYEIPPDWDKTLAGDFGWDHPTCFGSLATNPANGQLVHHLIWSQSEKPGRDAKIEIYDYFAEAGHPIDGFGIRVGDVAGKRGTKKRVRSGGRDKTDWEIFNSETIVPLPEGERRVIPSYALSAAVKDRIEGWGAVRELLQYKWEWRPIDPGIPMSVENRYRHITQQPGLVIFESCWETISSMTNLQRHKTIRGDAQPTTGIYGPGNGDDEATIIRYGVMAAYKGKYRMDKVRRQAESENPREREYHHRSDFQRTVKSAMRQGGKRTRRGVWG